jgi:hypothetical protein
MQVTTTSSRNASFNAQPKAQSSSQSRSAGQAHAAIGLPAAPEGLLAIAEVAGAFGWALNESM